MPTSLSWRDSKPDAAFYGHKKFGGSRASLRLGRAAARIANSGFATAYATTSRNGKTLPPRRVSSRKSAQPCIILARGSKYRAWV